MTHPAFSPGWFIVPLLLALAPADSKGLPSEPSGANTGWKFTEALVLRGHHGPAFGVAVTTDGRQVLTTGIDGTLRIWELPTGRPLGEIQAHQSWAVGLAVTSDGKQAVTSGSDKSARQWDLGARKELRRFEGYGRSVWSVAISADGTRLLTGSHDKTMRLYDLATGRDLRRFECPCLIWCAAFSPDGKHILAPGKDSVRLLNADTGAEERAWPLKPSLQCALAFSPDARRALCGSADGRLFLWDLQTGKQLHCFDGHAHTADARKQVVRFVAFAPDGKWAVTTGYDSTVRLWDLEGGKELARYDWHMEKTQAPRGTDMYMLFGVTFTPDGRRVVVAGADGLVRVLQINSPPPPIVSKPPPPKPEELAGLWKADGGEEWQITLQKDHYVGHLTGVPPFLRQAGFVEGELTLRGCTRTGPDTFKGEVLWRLVNGTKKWTEWRGHAFTVHGDHMSLTPPLRSYVRSSARAPLSFAQEWNGTWGHMPIRVHGNTATGTYTKGRGQHGPGTLTGTITGKVLHAEWKDNDGKAHGTLCMILAEDGHHFSMNWDTAAPTPPVKPTENVLGPSTHTSEGHVTLAVTGALVAGEPLTLGATVQHPAKGQTLKLELPAGLDLVKGKQLEMVPPPGNKDTAVVSWQLRAVKPGQYVVRVYSGSGAPASQTMLIRPRPEPSGSAAAVVSPNPKPAATSITMAVQVSGTLLTGEPLTVTATVQHPTHGQTLRLELPPGLERIKGREVEAVPTPAAGTHTSAVGWTIRATRPGQYTVRVHSGNVVVASPVLTIRQRPPAEHGHSIVRPTDPNAGKWLLSVPQHFPVGKSFAVTAYVSNPLPNQALTLCLAPKLQRLDGPQRQPVTCGARERRVSWKVKGLEPGLFSVRVRSSNGAQQEKTITISPPRDRYTLLDAQRALKMWVGMIPEEMEYDVDNSGHVDSHDAVLILQMAGVKLERKP